jgi:folate-binding protein YgfZ
MGNTTSEFEIAKQGPTWVTRWERALIEVEGRDRVSWLHNLTTNQVKTLGVGDGNYAFALNVQGRILFDLNILIRADSIWVDLDKRFLETAKKHFSKYTITESVTPTDRTEAFIRVGVIGQQSARLVAAMGVGNAAAMASLALGGFDWRGVEIVVIRHDFCGPMGFELVVPTAAFDAFEKAVFQSEFGPSVDRVSAEAIETLRIEAGIPWPGAEITDEYLPAETRQLERGVSYQKGCYLGQEVVERMRSRNVVARQLVGLRLADRQLPTVGGAISTPSGDVVGKVTSAVLSPAMGCAIALGYVKTSQAGPKTPLVLATANQRLDAVVESLPFALV